MIGKDDRAAGPVALIDRDRLATLRGKVGDAAFARMRAAFLDAVADRAEGVRAAVAAGDRHAAARLVHTLRGLCGNFGAPALAAAAEPLDRALSQGASWPAPADLAAFAEIAHRTRRAFDERIAPPEGEV